MSPRLLDANVVIALADAAHVHHGIASSWFAAAGEVVLCPVTEGALVRYLLRVGESARNAAALIEAFAAHPRVGFRADEVSYREVDVESLRGHRQATDAYLVALARHHGALLATFDSALAETWPEHTELIPTDSADSSS